VGCATGEITSAQYNAAEERIPRPGRVIVYDFRATPADIPANSAITGHYSRRQTPQTAEEVQLGRKLGSLVANLLVREILDMGMPAQWAGNGPPPQIGDVLISGQFVSIDEGDRGKRIFIGFGKGKGELKTHLEGYLTTQRGHRLLGSREISSAGGKGPGLLLPAIVTAATANPVGLLVNSAVKIRNERKGGGDTIQGAAKRTAKTIAKELKSIFRKQGWI
jgi:hypothetical protein